MELRLKYGENTMQADFADFPFKKIKGRSSRQFFELHTKHIATLQKPADIINQALDKPLGCHPFNQVFRGARNVLIVVPDSELDGRHGLARAEHYLPVLHERLQKLHVPKDEIRILMAKSAETSLPIDSRKSHLTLDGGEKVRLFWHDPHEHKSLEYIGLTRRGTPVFVNRLLLDADIVIICGSVAHHPFAGYDGGPRLIMPGCAGDETISRHYAHAIDLEAPRVHARCRDAMIDGNPVQEDAREAFRFITASFLLHMIWNDQQQLIGAIAGEPLQAFAAGCHTIDDMFGAPVTATNLALVSCGGFPADGDYRLAHTALHHAASIVRPNGVIILVAECRHGLGSEALSQWFQQNSADEPKKDWVTNPFNRSLYHRVFHDREAEALVALSTLQKAREAHIIMVSVLAPELVQRLGFIPAKSLQEAITLAADWLPDIFSALVLYNGTLLAPHLS